LVKPRTIEHKAKAKDSGFKAKDMAKDLSHKAKAKAKDLQFVLKDRPRPRTNNTVARSVLGAAIGPIIPRSYEPD
jgi:hypothetical protein